MKVVKRLVFTVLLFLFVAVSVSYFLFQNNKEWIEKELVFFLNENFQGFFAFEKLNYSLNANFSNLKLELDNVLIKSSGKSNDTIIYSDKTVVYLDIVPLLKDTKIHIEKVKIDQSFVNLTKDNKSLSIANAFKKNKSSTTTQQSSVVLNIKKIQIEECELAISIDAIDETVFLENVRTDLEIKNKKISVHFQSKQALNLSVPSLKFVKDFGKSKLKFFFEIDNNQKEINIRNGSLLFGKVGYAFDAQYNFNKEQKLDIHFNESYQHTQVVQETKGNVHFSKKGRIKKMNILLNATKISLDDVLSKYTAKSVASGNANLALNFSFEGVQLSKIVENATATLIVSGKDIVLKGADLDKLLKNYKKSQNFNLVDITAFAFAGPMGTVAVKGADFTKLLTTKFNNDDTTLVKDLIMELTLDNGIVHAKDVAFATRSNRLALMGDYLIPRDSIPTAKVTLLSSEGCELLSQEFFGNTSSLELKDVKVFEKLLGAVFNLFDKVTFRDCDPVYFGKIPHPVE